MRRWKLSAATEGYGFEVAPPGAGSGVVVHRVGKLARSPDPEADGDAARLFAALTELRGLIPGATLELSDDLHLVGVVGDVVALADDPDQELTAVPRDRAQWSYVPARRAAAARKAPAARPARRGSLTPALEAALDALLAGRSVEPLLLDAATAADAATRVLRALASAHKPKTPDRARCDGLRALARLLPPKAIIDAALDEPALIGQDASIAVADAMPRLETIDDVRDRLLAVWFDWKPTTAPDRFWDSMAWCMLREAARDPVVVVQLADAYDAAVLDERTLMRRHFNVGVVLSRSPAGVVRMIRRRRRERPDLRAPLVPAQLARIAAEAFPVAVPTLLIELASFRDRDALLLELARFADPRVAPVLERALATDQYTRVVADALLSIADPPSLARVAALADHEDPLVRIRAAQALVIRDGAAAVPGLVGAIRHAMAMGIWRREYGPGTWFNEQLGRPADALAAPFRYRGRWPTVDAAVLACEPSVEASSGAAVARMLSPNPDIRRDAIELAHAEAIARRDPTCALTLARAERVHRALCDAALLPQTDRHGSCSRVRVTGYWSDPMWRKRAKIPFDPMYKFDYVTWDWLERHVGEHVPQVIAPEFASVRDEETARSLAATIPVRSLTFTRSEVAAWDAAEAEIAGA